MNRVLGAAIMPFRVGAMALVAVGGAAAMLFTKARGFGILLSRTLIDYRSEIGDPLSNSIVAAVVGWVARNFPEAPVRVVREGMTGDEARIPPGPSGVGRFLRLLERPNPYYSGPLQWMATISDWMIGNAYWFKERAPGGRRVVGYWWIPAWMIEPKWPENDGSVFISHYEYTVDGMRYRVEVDDVVHFRNGIDPRNPRKGLSRLGSLFREIFTDNEAAAFTASLLRNLGVPGVILSPSNTASPNQRSDPEKVKTAFKEKFGGDSRGEPLVLTAPTDVKVLSWSPEQLNLKALRRIPEERVSAVTGVPAGVAGLGAGLDRNTFTNYAEANKAAITQGLFPGYRLIAADLELQALPDFDVPAVIEGLDVWFDWTVMAAMQEAAEAVWKRAESAATKGLLMRSDFLRMIGRKPADDGSDDVYVAPNNYLFTPAGTTPPSPKPAVSKPSGFGAIAETLPIAVADGSANGNGHHLELTGAPA